MAYDKVYPQNGQSILAFDTNQEDRVASGFGDIADYVVERGSNANGNWEKWSSGKLVQYGIVRKVHGAEGQIIIDLPAPYTTISFKYLSAVLGGYNGTKADNVRSVYQQTTPGTKINVYVTVGTVIQNINFMVIGTWF